MKVSKQTKTSLLSFIITFFVSLVIFALLAWFVYGAISSIFSSDKSEKSENSENLPVSSVPDDESKDNPELPLDDFDVIEGESFTVLVAGLSVTGDTVESLTMVDVDKENRTVMLYPVNPDAMVYVGHDTAGNVNVRLGDICKYKDFEYLCEKLSVYAKMKLEEEFKIDYYFTFTADAFVTVVDALNKDGIYTYTVQNDMMHTYSKDPELEKYNIDFKRGDKLTEGIDIYNVLRYQGDSASDGMSRQASIARDLIKVLVKNHIKGLDSKKIISTFKAILEIAPECKTNLSIEGFISEAHELLSVIDDFSFDTSKKFVTSTLNFK